MRRATINLVYARMVEVDSIITFLDFLVELALASSSASIEAWYAICLALFSAFVDVIMHFLVISSSSRSNSSILALARVDASSASFISE